VTGRETAPDSLQVVVDVRVLQELEILNQGSKMLKEFLRQTENNDMAQIKAGKRK
jgi:hypothetical protein